MSDQESAPMEKHLRVLTVTLDYPPPLSGGYGVMCAQVCTWLKSRGHEVLVLTALPAEREIVEATSGEDEGPVPVRRTLRSYWDGSACLDLPFQEALTVERHNQAQMRDVLATYCPDVVAFWHMGAMSLGLITTTARLGFPLVFVIGDDWLCYGGWTDGWLRWCNEHPEEAAAVEQHTGLPSRLPDLGALGIFCFVSAYTKRRAEQIGGWHFPRAQILFPGLSPTEFPPLAEVPDQPWRWRLLWVGRVIEEKGIETAIHALSLLSPHVTLSIVGMVDPPYQRHLEALAATLGVASRLSFSLASRRQVRQHYQQADATLFTSMMEHEAFGLVPLEAMASGCPVIATGVGGSSEYCLGGYPMHEVAAHPQAAQVIRLFHEQWQVEFEPLPTTGVPLATRPDWRELLETLGAVGSSTLWFAFHGADSVHDRMVMRQGAYRESLHAVELTRAFGMHTGCNLFLTKENVGHFDRLVADLQHAGMQQIIPEVSGFTPNARGRRFEALRPEWQDVQPLEGIIDAMPEMCLWRPRWHENLQTEAWYVHQAQIGSWPATPQRRSIELVCRPNLDVYRGLAGQYTRYYGNLHRDGVDWVLGRAVADGAWSYDELWFTPEQLLPVQELATRFGDAAGSRVHFGFDSIRYWWLDCARRADRVS